MADPITKNVEAPQPKEGVTNDSDDGKVSGAVGYMQVINHLSGPEGRSIAGADGVVSAGARALESGPAQGEAAQILQSFQVVSADTEKSSTRSDSTNKDNKA